MSYSAISRSMPVKDKILVALDVTSIEKAIELVHQLKNYVGGFKIGMELCTNAGTPQVIDLVSREGGQVFLDLKFKDIPNTVAGAARAASRSGVLMFNVHCDGGLEMMKSAVNAVSQEKIRPLIIGVTVLTSMDQTIMNSEIRVPGNINEQVVHLAKLAKMAGLDGVVCSPHEVKEIKNACGPEFITVVPGIRPGWALAGDQQRIMSPAEAIAEGADYLVIGRPITSPPSEVGSPVDAARHIIHEIDSFFAAK